MGFMASNSEKEEKQRQKAQALLERRHKMKKIGLVTLSLAIIAATPVTPYAAHWFSDSNGAWYFQEDSGNLRCNAWIEDGGAWYYVGSDGKMLTNTTTPDGYTVGADGRWITDQQSAAAASIYTAPATITLGMKNAVGRAESYLRYTSFSKKGLIEQLEYEGFTRDEATYAVETVPVDWNDQCAKKAASYLKYSSFSRKGLADQLEYEGFTASQIAYGLSAVGY